MPRYVAFLRGVSPLNCKMPALKGAFEAAGFTQVRTLLSSGNVAFDARSGSEAAIERRAEAAMRDALGRHFQAIVRSASHLHELLANDLLTPLGVPAEAKRVVTFARHDLVARLPLPLATDGAAVMCAVGREAYSAYLPGAEGPVFMKLIEKAFGNEVTTRTWATVARCARA
ncbi:DUF1697 domain-containing protein [Variovorax sp.]|uniref:DUF1697 domain-containing protein n=1 Tax=Variovorax sp. TaxID=1871043 RepID=UPI002D463222|nr:DUF1697 domain-containing protein [Variovorax sp.]HYP84652.1 DUF1697 domain-containing protein [Variovorax sp.]